MAVQSNGYSALVLQDFHFWAEHKLQIGSLGYKLALGLASLANSVLSSRIMAAPQSQHMYRNKTVRHLGLYGYIWEWDGENAQGNRWHKYDRKEQESLNAALVLPDRQGSAQHGQVRCQSQLDESDQQGHRLQASESQAASRGRISTR